MGVVIIFQHPADQDDVVACVDLFEMLAIKPCHHGVYYRRTGYCGVLVLVGEFIGAGPGKAIRQFSLVGSKNIDRKSA